MGLLARFHCRSCGYSSGQLGLGPAPYPDRYDPALVVCKSCRQLGVVHRPRVAEGCEGCGEELTLLDGPDDIQCPRCGSVLVEEPVGLWD